MSVQHAELTETEQWIVRRAVLRFAPVSPWLDREDLEQVASVGVLEAREKHDPDRHPPYFAYASMLVRRSIVAALRRASPVPQWLQVYAKNARRAAGLLRENGHPVTDESMAEMLGVSPDEHRRRRERISSLSRPQQLETPADFDSDYAEWAVSAYGSDTAVFACERHDALEIVLARLACEHPRHARILQKTYFARQMQLRVTRDEGLNPSQIAFLRREGLVYLRRYLEENGLCAEDMLSG